MPARVDIWARFYHPDTRFGLATSYSKRHEMTLGYEPLWASLKGTSNQHPHPFGRYARISLPETITLNHTVERESKGACYSIAEHCFRIPFSLTELRLQLRSRPGGYDLTVFTVNNGSRGLPTCQLGPSNHSSRGWDDWHRSWGGCANCWRWAGSRRNVPGDVE